MSFRGLGKYDDARKVQLVREILNAPCEQGNRAIAEQLGMERETVRRVRFGQLWRDVLPHLERLEASSHNPGRIRTCDDCTHWKAIRIDSFDDGIRVRRHGICTLDIPESIHPKFARGCGAFADRELQHV